MSENLHAVIDLGTNTFHLLILQINSKDNFSIIHKEQIPVKIGEGGILQGIIQPEAQKRMFEALSKFKQAITKFNISHNHIIALATSALRAAKNNTAIIQKISEELDLEVRIISGDEEATYIYHGVKAALQIGQDPALIMDIGGGSVEFIIGNENKIFWQKSFEIGAQRLLDQFATSDPISFAAVERLNNYLEETLIPLTNAVHQYAPATLIGSSGTFGTLCDINFHQKHLATSSEIEKEMWLSMQDFKRIYQELLHHNHAARLKILGMRAMRADMIVVASILLHFVLEKYNLSTIHVSTYALKEGIIMQEILSKIS